MSDKLQTALEFADALSAEPSACDCEADRTIVILAARLRELERENAELREAGAELLAACPHHAEGEQRAMAAFKMRLLLDSLSAQKTP
jgi:hypothetical protein